MQVLSDTNVYLEILYFYTCLYSQQYFHFSMRDTQVRLGKDSIGKGSINNNVGRKMSHFTPPTVEEVQEYCFERGNAVDAQSFVDF